MIVHAIQTELVRLQLHPVNLSVSGTDDGQVALEGSLLRYWILPPSLDGQWLLAQLQGMPDAAGPEVVMNWIFAAYGKQSRILEAAEAGTQLRLFDPQIKTPAAQPAATKKER